MRHSVALLALSIALCSSAFAHPGGLDKNGCHNDRKNGGYHCHGGGSAPAPAPRATSTTAPRSQPLASVSLSSASSKEGTLAAQYLLVSLGYSIELTGTEDLKTRRAIAAFLESRGLGSKLRVVTPELLLELARAISQKNCR